MRDYVEDMNFLKLIFKSIIFEKNLGLVDEHEIAKPGSLV